MAKHEEQAEQLERDAQRLEEQGERIDRRIEETRSDWQTKEQDVSVPGAQPDSENQEPEAGEEEEGDSD
jgi:hypothetical protein